MTLIITKPGVNENARIRKDFALASRISKLYELRYDSTKLKPGDDAILFTKAYKKRLVKILSINDEMPASHEYFKVFDAEVLYKNDAVQVYCVYFGMWGKICLMKDVTYELFEEIIDENKLHGNLEKKVSSAQPGRPDIQRKGRDDTEV